MSIHEIEMNKGKIRRIPREKVEDKREYQRRHELSLLELLIQAHPERAKMIVARLREAA